MPGTRTAYPISMRVVDSQGNLVGYLPETISSQVLDFAAAVHAIYDPVWNTRANFTTDNPVITIGRMAIETDTGCVKIGDGVTAYNSLRYFNISSAPNGTPIRMTAAQFTAANPVLGDGIFGIESDTGYSKLGDGSTAWNSLEYFTTKVGTVTFELDS